MKEKRKLETTKKERRKAIYLAIYATVLLLVPLLLSLVFGLDEATPSYIIAIIIAAIIVFVGAYAFVMFLNNYHRNNPTEEPKNPENKIVNKETIQFVYFVSYHFQDSKGYPTGVGSTVIRRNNLIETGEDIEQLREHIAENLPKPPSGCWNVCIISYQLMREVREVE